MPHIKSARSKRKLVDTQFAEVISGPTSRLLPDDGPNKKEMEDALSQAGFDIEGGNTGDAEVLKLYKRHIFERSKARKQNQNATPYDELDDAKIRSIRSRRRSTLANRNTRVRKELSLSPESNRFSFLTNSELGQPPSTSDPFKRQSPVLPAIQQEEPSTGPVRTRRISTRISAARGVSAITTEDTDPNKTSSKKKAFTRQSPYPSAMRRSQRNLGKQKNAAQSKSNDHASQDLGFHQNTTFTIPESPNNSDKAPQSKSDTEPIGVHDRRKNSVDSNREKTRNPCSNRLPRKFTTASTNTFGLRVSAPARFPSPSRPVSRRQKRRICSDSESEGDEGSDDELESEGYLPTSNIDSDDDFLEPSSSKNHTQNQPRRKSVPSKPRSRDSKISSNNIKSRTRSFQQRTSHRTKLSSSEADIESPPKLKKKPYLSPQYPESSEDTPDLHEPSNFRTSRIETRLGSARLDNNVEQGPSDRNFCSTRIELLENSEDDASDSVFMPGKKKWKGKGRALDSDDMREEDDDILMLSGRRMSQGSSPDPENKIDEEWDAGDLFGEQHKLHRSASPDLNPAQRPPDSETSPSRIHESGIEDFRKAISLLKSVCGGDSKKATQIKKQVEVLTNMMKTYMNNTPSTDEQQDRFVYTSSRENSSNPKRSPSVAPRASRIRALIIALIRTLYGLKRGDKLVPSGASPVERRNWMMNISLHELLNKSNEPVSIEDPTPSTGDRYFPYPNGPGGEKASRTSVKIMWDVMRSVGVTSFRPDFSEPLSSPGNMFLFRMATVILIKLVKSGEYSDISPNDLEPKNVLNLIVAHVRGTWARYYREQRQWSQERLASRAKRRNQKARVNSVREGRLAYVMSHKPLWPLSKVIQDCCSDDETDYEDEDRRKYCKVRILRWRSSQLDMVFEAIDAARASNNPIKSQPGNIHRTRTRSDTNPISDLLPPEQIYKDCISRPYYDQLQPWEKEDIKIINKSILTTVKDMISKKLLPTSV